MDILTVWGLVSKIRVYQSIRMREEVLTRELLLIGRRPFRTSGWSIWSWRNLVEKGFMLMVEFWSSRRTLKNVELRTAQRRGHKESSNHPDRTREKWMCWALGSIWEKVGKIRLPSSNRNKLLHMKQILVSCDFFFSSLAERNMISIWKEHYCSYRHFYKLKMHKLYHSTYLLDDN